MNRVQHAFDSPVASSGKARSDASITPPPKEQRLALVDGPYYPPSADVGNEITCMLRGRATVCGWGTGRIRWPLIRVGHGGKGAYVMTAELARAVRHESQAAMQYWWGVGTTTVSQWRKKLGVDQFNEGTRRLWSLWKEPKLPDEALTISKLALRRARLAKGLTQQQLARALGWNSANAYAQLESGDRHRTTPATLNRLAQALECQANELLQLAHIRKKVGTGNPS